MSESVCVVVCAREFCSFLFPDKVSAFFLVIKLNYLLYIFRSQFEIFIFCVSFSLQPSLFASSRKDSSGNIG